jgi:hypothetical protein
MLARRLEAADLGEPIEKRLVRAVVDPAGAVPLDVAVAADWTRPRALAADVAAQEQHVDDLAHRVDAVLVLREPEAPGDDHLLRRQIRIGELSDCRLVHAGVANQVVPGSRLDERAVVVDAGGVLLDELSVENVGIAFRRLEDRLGDAAQQREVSANPNLHVHRADLGRVERRHVDELVRDDRPPRGRFDQRVDVDELGAPAVGLSQPREHPRRVRAAFSAISQIASAASQSCRSTAPLPLPIAAVSPRPLASWHMFEQSGRLFVPNSRTQSW